MATYIAFHTVAAVDTEVLPGVTTMKARFQSVELKKRRVNIRNVAGRGRRLRVPRVLCVTGRSVRSGLLTVA